MNETKHDYGMRPEVKSAWDELLKLGFEARTISSDDGRNDSYYCLGSFAFGVDTDPRDGVRITLLHGEWDEASGTAEFREELNADDLDALAIALPPLQTLARSFEGNK